MGAVAVIRGGSGGRAGVGGVADPLRGAWGCCCYGVGVSMLRDHHGVPLPLPWCHPVVSPTAGGGGDAISRFSRSQGLPLDGIWGDHCSAPHIPPQGWFTAAGPTSVQGERGSLGPSCPGPWGPGVVRGLQCPSPSAWESAPKGTGTHPFTTPGGQAVGVEDGYGCFYAPIPFCSFPSCPRDGEQGRGVLEMVEEHQPPAAMPSAASLHAPSACSSRSPPARSSCPHLSRHSGQAGTGARSPVPAWGRAVPLTQAEELPGHESPLLQHPAAPERPCNELCLVSDWARSLCPRAGGCRGDRGADAGPGSSRSGRGHDAVRGVEGGESAVTSECCPPSAPLGTPALLRQPGLPPGTAEPGQAPCAPAPRGRTPVPAVTGGAWGSAGRPAMPAQPCQLAAGAGAALTSAASRAVSWEKSVHGALLPWQCNLLRASKPCIASPWPRAWGLARPGRAVETGSGA